MYLNTDKWIKRKGEALLTKRESSIATLMERGFSNKEIAAELNLTVGTVVVYISKLYSKLGLNYSPGKQRDTLIRLVRESRYE